MDDFHSDWQKKAGVGHAIICSACMAAGILWISFLAVGAAYLFHWLYGLVL